MYTSQWQHTRGVSKKLFPISFCRTGKTCLFKTEDIGATITSYKVLPTGDENALQNAVATIGPISVAIDASKPTFHFYKKGVYHSPGYYKKSRVSSWNINQQRPLKIPCENSNFVKNFGP